MLGPVAKQGWSRILLKKLQFSGAGAEAAQAGGRANANGNAQIAGTAATSTAGSKRPRESIEEGEDAVDVAPKRQHVTGAADVSSSRPQLPLQRALPTSVSPF